MTPHIPVLGNTHTYVFVCVRAYVCDGVYTNKKKIERYKSDVNFADVYVRE